MRVTKTVAIFTFAVYKMFAMKFAKSGCFLECRCGLPREVMDRPKEWSTASTVSWTKWSYRRGSNECLRSRVVW